jgi:hypothetical protein
MAMSASALNAFIMSVKTAEGLAKRAGAAMGVFSICTGSGVSERGK